MAFTAHLKFLAMVALVACLMAVSVRADTAAPSPPSTSGTRLCALRRVAPGLWEVSCGVSAASGTSRRWVTVPAAAVDCAASRAWTPHPPPFCTCLRCAAGNGTAPLYQTNAMVSVLPILLLFFIPM